MILPSAKLSSAAIDGIKQNTKSATDRAKRGSTGVSERIHGVNSRSFQMHQRNTNNPRQPLTKKIRLVADRLTAG